MDFWISKWISGFQSGFLDFRLDFWISEWISGFRWISGFQIGFLPTVYEISFVADPSGETAKTRLVHAHLESGTLGERRSVKLMSSTIWGSCVLCSPPPSIGPRNDAPQQEVLSLL